MKISGILSVLFLICAFVGSAQKTSFEKNIREGNWLLDFDKQKDLSVPAINDSVQLYKVSKRLKNKVKRPIRFQKSGMMKTPSVCFGCCGTVGRLEALWALKWRDNGEWSISESGDDVFLHYFQFTLKLIESDKTEFTFVIVEN